MSPKGSFPAIDADLDAIDPARADWNTISLSMSRKEINDAFCLAVEHLDLDWTEGPMPKRYAVIRNALNQAKRFGIPIAKLVKGYSVPTEHLEKRADAERYAISTINLINKAWRDLKVDLTFQIVMFDGFVIKEIYFKLIRRSSGPR